MNERDREINSKGFGLPLLPFTFFGLFYCMDTVMHQTYQRAIFAAGSLLTGPAVLQCRVTMTALDVEVVFAGFWVLGPDEAGMVLLGTGEKAENWVLRANEGSAIESVRIMFTILRISQ